MQDVDWEKDDPFEDQRDQVESPMRRLLFEYGRPYWFSVTVGLISSVLARALDLLPALLLAVAIDAIFGDAKYATIRKEAGLKYADFVFSSSVQLDVNQLLLEEVNPDATVFVEAEWADEAVELYENGADFVAITPQLSAE